MPEALKFFFDATVVNRIAGMVAAVNDDFPVAAFKRAAMRGLDALELVPRGRQIAHALHQHLPSDFAEAAPILTASLGPRLDSTMGNGMAPFLSGSRSRRAMHASAARWRYRSTW